MVDFISLEEAAEQLDIPESLLRQWVKKGFARASRRGGGYVLRTTEVDRLLANPVPASESALSGESESPFPRSSTEDAMLSEEERALRPNSEDVAPQRPKVLPPRPRSEEQWPAKDRRNRMGRRGSDFSLESMNSEVRSAVEQSLDMLDGRLNGFHYNLEQTLAAHQDSLAASYLRMNEHWERVAQLLENPPSAPAPSPDKHALLKLEAEVERRTAELRQKSAEVDELRKRCADVDELRRRCAEVDELRRRCAEVDELRKRCTELDELRKRCAEVDDLRKRCAEVDELRKRGAELEDVRGRAADADDLRQRVVHLEKVREEFRLRLEESAEQERVRRGEFEAAFLKNQEALRLSQAENEDLQKKLRSRDSSLGLIEQERARQIEVLAAELAQLRDLRERTEESRSILEDQLNHTNSRLDQAQERNRELEGVLSASQERMSQMEASVQGNRQREDELSQEVRRWKEQVNGLQFKLQMQGQGGASHSVEESRRLMERLAEMEGQMFEKDRLISQSYRELSELRSKLDEQQRVFYELQQQTDKEKEEWSQVVAQQLRVTGELNNQRQQQPSSPQEKGRWGLFKLRGDT